MAEVIPFPSRRRVHHILRNAECAAFSSKTVGAARNRLGSLVDKRRERLEEIGCDIGVIDAECRQYQSALDAKLFEILNANQMLG